LQATAPVREHRHRDVTLALSNRLTAAALLQAAVLYTAGKVARQQIRAIYANMINSCTLARLWKDSATVAAGHWPVRP
jgi:hypothetical protein